MVMKVNIGDIVLASFVVLGNDEEYDTEVLCAGVIIGWVDPDTASLKVISGSKETGRELPAMITAKITDLFVISMDEFKGGKFMIEYGDGPWDSMKDRSLDCGGIIIGAGKALQMFNSVCERNCIAILRGDRYFFIKNDGRHYDLEALAAQNICFEYRPNEVQEILDTIISIRRYCQCSHNIEATIKELIAARKAMLWEMDENEKSILFCNDWKG